MSSGLDFANLGLSGPESYTSENEHMRIYADGLNIFDHAVNQPPEIPPDTQWRYRNSDPSDAREDRPGDGRSAG